MMPEVDIYNFRVMYQMLGAKRQIQENWVCASLHELMQNLKNQGVTKNTVQCLYVHQSQVGVKTTGEVMEVVAFEAGAQPQDKVIVTPPPKKETKPKEKKPEIKAVTPPAEPKKLISCMFYQSVQV
jgi:hypothetical protein